jgi:hypothetical protein
MGSVAPAAPVVMPGKGFSAEDLRRCGNSCNSSVLFFVFPSGVASERGASSDCDSGVY